MEATPKPRKAWASRFPQRVRVLRRLMLETKSSSGLEQRRDERQRPSSQSKQGDGGRATQVCEGAHGEVLASEVRAPTALGPLRAQPTS